MLNFIKDIVLLVTTVLIMASTFLVAVRIGEPWLILLLLIVVVVLLYFFFIHRMSSLKCKKCGSDRPLIYIPLVGYWKGGCEDCKKK